MHQSRLQKISKLQQCPSNIRNICIMAHVDHGKTTLADVLVASNGVISQKMAGKLRYLDSREDEQQRGITMKSSAIALQHLKDGKDYLINLIDSPGHVDFSSEVSTAIRLCDGAVILVDVIEGVCPQSKVSLRLAWKEGIKPVLVLNKIDRLIVDRKLNPIDAHICLQQILEQVNAVVGELFAADVLGKSAKSTLPDSNSNSDESADQVYDWSSGLEESDDSQVYFSPDRGNVIFASALDGWGFGIHHFASLYSKKLGVKEEILQKTLWGDYYLNTKTKKIMKGALSKAKKPLFVQFILENIWAVYEAVMLKRDKVMTEKIVNSLNLQIHPRDIKHSDARMSLQAICNQWLPLSSAVLDMVCEILPSPVEISEERVEKLISFHLQKFDSLPEETQALKKEFMACKSSEDVPVIVFISKMFPFEKEALPRYRQRILTPEEIALRREQLRLKRIEKENISSNVSDKVDEGTKEEDHSGNKNETEENSDSRYVFFAFARIFSGKLQRGRKLYVLGPKHNPKLALQKFTNGVTLDETLKLKDLKYDQHITCCTIEDLYLLMGREIESLEEVPAGNILGIGGLEEHVLKTATLSTTLACPPFIELVAPVVPILRVAIEPAHPVEMKNLIRGLKLLNQADAAVQVLIQETGEHVIITAGEIHLQRCLDDLRQRYAKIELNVSQPIVPFKETIISPPKVDMVNEVIEDKNQIVKPLKATSDDNSSGVIIIQTPNKLCTVHIKAVPLPPAVTELLENNSEIIKVIDKNFSASQVNKMALSEETLRTVAEFQAKLSSLFKEAGKQWVNAADQIWAFGPKRCGPNVLLNCVQGYHRPSLISDIRNTKTLPNSVLSQFDGSFISGFQLASLSGPLCEEPMMGVCFKIENWEIQVNNKDLEFDQPGELLKNQRTPNSESVQGNATSHVEGENGNNVKMSTEHVDGTQLIEDSLEYGAPYGPFSGQIMSVVKEGCRRAFQTQPQRLMTAMYSCNIQVTSEVLGKMYGVLGKRSGRVLSSDLQEGSQIFNIVATLPVIESFDFANEMRKQTSGLAIPQLVFSHWEIVDTDPFWVPSTEEEYALFGEKADSENRARRYMNAVRRRKGLSVDEKIVEHAEKQRTLTRNK